MIRSYVDKDKEILINLLRLNTPLYFAESEEKDFVMYLDNYADNYFVIEKNGNIIAAGGFNYFENNTIVRIAWDIIHPDFQRKGIGKELTQYRIDQIKKDDRVHHILVRTSQLVYPFYEKMGFILEKVEKDFWAKDFDLYQMKMLLK